MSAKLQRRNRKTLGYLFIISGLVVLFILLVQYKSTSKSTKENHRKIYQDEKAQPEGYPIYPKPWTLINIKIQYLINNLVCRKVYDSESDNKNTLTKHYLNYHEDVFMLILITSHAGDVKTRNTIRKILPNSELDRIQMRRLFLLARPDDDDSSSTFKNSKYKQITMAEIYEESEKFRDILMGDFRESYHNLTYKHLMGMEWSYRYCSQTTFVLKQDDDIIVDFYQLSLLLQKSEFWIPLVKHKTIVGKVLANQTVIRDPKSKWFVPRQQMLAKVFPDFVSGWAYITTPKVIKDLVAASRKLNYFWIDDAHITGTLRKTINATLIDLDKYFTIYKGHLLCCISTSVYSKSKLNQPYWCDYVVGPPNDDLQLMEIFQNHSRFCHTTKTCLRREGKDSLNKTCLITDKMVVNTFQTDRQIMGVWKPIRL